MKVPLIVGAVAVVAAAPVVYEYASSPDDVEPCTGDVMLFFDVVRDDRQGVNWTSVAGHSDYPEVESALANVADDGNQGQAVIHISRAESLEQAIRDAQANQTARFPGEASRGLILDYDGVDILYSRMVRCVD